MSTCVKPSWIASMYKEEYIDRDSFEALKTLYYFFKRLLNYNMHISVRLLEGEGNWDTLTKVINITRKQTNNTQNRCIIFTSIFVPKLSINQLSFEKVLH